MQLSEKLNNFCGIIIAFLESALNFEHFLKNELDSSNVSEVFDCERCGFLNAKSPSVLNVLN